MASRRLWCG
uniref:Uncharacterized protein n=1 Tax=Arundo donax TaxID=35708 RepID=A0A0A9HQL7_ARUDO